MAQPGAAAMEEEVEVVIVQQQVLCLTPNAQELFQIAGRQVSLTLIAQTLDYVALMDVPIPVLMDQRQNVRNID